MNIGEISSIMQCKRNLALNFKSIFLREPSCCGFRERKNHILECNAL